MECLEHWEDFCRTVLTGPGSALADIGQDSSRWPKGKAVQKENLHPKVLMFVLTVPANWKAHRERSVYLQKMKKPLQTTQLPSLELAAALEAVEAFAAVFAFAPECVFVP